MDLELATIEDIVTELSTRQIRFAFAAIENTNTPRSGCMCFSGKGATDQEVSELFQIGRDVFEQRSDGDGRSAV